MNLENMGIEHSYNMHSDYVQELLKKAQIYGPELRDNILRDFQIYLNLMKNW